VLTGSFFFFRLRDNQLPPLTLSSTLQLLLSMEVCPAVHSDIVFLLPSDHPPLCTYIQGTSLFSQRIQRHASTLATHFPLTWGNLYMHTLQCKEYTTVSPSQTRSTARIIS
jgi:hypothetical protein